MPRKRNTRAALERDRLRKRAKREKDKRTGLKAEPTLAVVMEDDYMSDSADGVPSQAYMGMAKPLARRQASLLEKMPSSNALDVVPIQGRLSTPKLLGMPPSSDSQTRECTPLRVPWHHEGSSSELSCLARQSKLVGQSVIVGTSIIENNENIGTNKQEKNKNMEQEKNKHANKNAKTENDITRTENMRKQCKGNDDNAEKEYVLFRKEDEKKNAGMNKMVQFNSSTSIFDDEFVQNSDSKIMASHVQRHSVQGNFHQAHPIFGDNAGSQCVSNCLAAVSYHKIKSVNSWQPIDMDRVLMCGNELYTFLKRNLSEGQNHLLINELPTELECFDMQFKYNIKESIASLIANGECEPNYSEFNALPVDEALQLSIMESNACFVCFGGNTMLIGKIGEHFFVFDSHSRSVYGMLDVNGSSTCVVLTSIDDVLNHIISLAASMGYSYDVECEFTGISCEYITSSEIEHSVHSFTPTNRNDEVQFICETRSSTSFLPLTRTFRETMCTRLGIPCNIDYTCDKGGSCQAGSPSVCEKIVGDENCFFRALSFSLSGSESFYKSIRQMICKHLLQNGSKFSSIMRRPDENMNKYMESSGMLKDGTYATEVEIFAVSHMLEIDIYTYSNGKWVRFSGVHLDKSIHTNHESIYLNHRNQIHYDVVLAVNSDMMGAQLQSDENDGKLNRSKENLPFSKEYKKKMKEKKEKRIKREVETCSDTRKGNAFSYKMRLQTMRTINKQRYHTNVEYRMKKQEQSNRRYQCDEKYRESKCFETVDKYWDDEEYREKKRKAGVDKYWDDEEYREKKRTAGVDKYWDDEEYREKKRTAGVDKYWDDEEYKVKKRTAGVDKYWDDEEYREKKLTAGVDKYWDDKEYREKKRKAGVDKYWDDEEYRGKRRSAGVDKYWYNEQYREEKCKASIDKYWDDTKHRENVILEGIRKYKENKEYQQNMKRKNREKYQISGFRSKKITDAKQRYNKSPGVRNKMLLLTCKRREMWKEKRKEMATVINSFKTKACKGPSRVCSCCLRLLFENQVQHCNLEIYKKNSSVADLCITKKYLHNSCNETCASDCERKSLWICKTCHRKIMIGEVPAESAVNNMHLEDILEHLRDLNSLEQHLIALHIPFMKVMALPQGGQNFVQGPVVCVPTNLDKAAR